MHVSKPKDKDMSNWKFTSRIFLVDTVSGIPVSQDSELERPNVVRYLSKMEIKIRMIDTREEPEKAGRMYPPIVKVEYAEITLDDLANREEVPFRFEVNYEMDNKESKKDIEACCNKPHLSLSKLTNCYIPRYLPA